MLVYFLLGSDPDVHGVGSAEADRAGHVLLGPERLSSRHHAPYTAHSVHTEGVYYLSEIFL